jgi:L-threonylcarbamoyladenylate synthase
MIRLPIDPARPDERSLSRAVEFIRCGEVVAIPTDTLYGLAANPFDAAAVRRVFEVKGRADGQPLPLIAADMGQIAAQVGQLPVPALQLAARFWPGPLTLVVPAPARLAGGVSGGTGTVGVRVPNHMVARKLCDVAGTMLTATSANVSGELPSADPDHVMRTLGQRVALLLDAGPTPGGPPSTVIDVTGGQIRLVRTGAIGWEDIDRCLRAGD